MQIRHITAEQLRDKNESSTSHVVINVLSLEHYNNCHIAGSVNIPVDKLKDEVANWDKDKEIVVYCASPECPASGRAYKLLTDLGFTNVWAYEGGIKEWREKQFPTEGPCSG